MGVPAFYRWITEKFPKTVQDVLEARLPLTHDLDLSTPNPSALECDNFYIDMNGIIHPCSHPENGPQPETEEEMYENVCRYVDRLFRAIRPRRMLYLAIDGVAPRAKMNQQRSRRFRSAQEARDMKALEEDLRKHMIEEGMKVPKKKEGWDSNVITPGTEFMRKLSKHLKKYIENKMKTSPDWRKIQVIFSDASVPGEGEHKIMSHIRIQRSHVDYDPNLVHVLHGLDADLIMLALATHEVNFYISREEVNFGWKAMELATKRKIDSGFQDAQNALDDEVGLDAMEMQENKGTPLQRFSVPILREYLEFEFLDVIKTVSYGPELERLEHMIDDFVFLCFFVGNDFLPHLPSLDIRDGALDFLLNVYKHSLPDMGGFITSDGGEVDLKRVNVILKAVAKIEDYVFQQRHRKEMESKDYHDRMRKRKHQLTGSEEPPDNAVAPPQVNKVGKSARVMTNTQDDTQEGVALGRNHQYKEHARKKLKVSHTEKANRFYDTTDDVTNDKPPKSQLDGNPNEATNANNPKKSGADDQDSDADLWEQSDDENGTVNANSDDNVALTEAENENAKKALKIKLAKAEKERLAKYRESVQDNVRLHESGWKDRYYNDKCKAEDLAEYGGRNHLFRQYILGLVWVMKYYYSGVPSWKWYFPFHYAPFSSDLVDVHTWFKPEDLEFDLSEPFSPVEQLMGVLPNDSAHCVPKESRWLMGDPESPILDYYPKEVPCDPNGKAMPWLWVVLLPFIDEKRLLAALRPTMKHWSKEEKKCNKKGDGAGFLYVHKDKVLLNEGKNGKKRNLSKFKIDDLVMGYVSDINVSKGVCRAVFEEPEQKPHRSIIYGKLPQKVLNNDDQRIRRPRLSRGGFTIANMGGNPATHNRNRYGPNNNHNYNTLMPANTRWNDSMNPQKTHYNQNRTQHHSRPYQHQQHPHRKPYRQQNNPHQHNQYNNSSHQQSYPNRHHITPSWQPPPVQPHQQHHFHQNHYQRPPSVPYWQRPPPPVPTHGTSSHTSYSFNQNPVRDTAPRWTSPSQQQGDSNVNSTNGGTSGGVDPGLMMSLRSQLANTIKQNRDARRNKNA